MPADDKRTIVLRATDGVEVLLVDGQPGRAITESEVFFLRNALVPVPPDMAENFFIKTRTVGVADLNPNIYKNQTAVVLANVSELTPDDVTAIKDYVQAGGGLIVFPGDNVTGSTYNSSLGELLPAKLGDKISGPFTPAGQRLRSPDRRPLG